MGVRLLSLGGPGLWRIEGGRYVLSLGHLWWIVAVEPHGNEISRMGIVGSSSVNTHRGAATVLKCNLALRCEPSGRLPGLLSFCPRGNVCRSFIRNGTRSSTSGGYSISTQ